MRGKPGHPVSTWYTEDSVEALSWPFWLNLNRNRLCGLAVLALQHGAKILDMSVRPRHVGSEAQHF